MNEHVSIITGNLPHVEQLHQLNKLKNHCIEIKAAAKSLNNTLEESVSKAIHNKVKDSEVINAAILDEQIRELEGTLLACLDQLSVGARDGPEPQVDVEDVEASQVPIVPKVNEFWFKGQYWCVPENFELPKKTKRLNGWQMWLCGQVVVSNNVTYKLKPFRLLTGKDLHKKSVSVN